MQRNLTLLFAAALAAGTAAAAPADFSVNGERISAAAQQKLIDAGLAQGRGPADKLEAMVKDQLIARTLLVQEANKRKLAQDPEVADMIQQTRATILADAVLDAHLKAHPVTDAEILAAYNAQKQRYGDTEYRVRHILVATEPEAQAVLKRLRAGEDFAKVAKEVSTDNGTKESGGDLEWASPGSMVPEFGEAMKSQKKGEVSAAPVKTRFGYHILRVDDTRPAELFPALEHTKSQIREVLTQKKMSDYVESLRAKAVIR